MASSFREVPAALRQLKKKVSRRLSQLSRKSTTEDSDHEENASPVTEGLLEPVPDSLLVDALNEFRNHDPLSYAKRYRNTYVKGTLSKPLQFVEEWAKSGNRNVLIVLGKALMGKTVLATELCRRGNSEIQKMDGEVSSIEGQFPLVAVHFFPSDGLQRMNSFRWVVRSIAFQLASVFPGYLDALNLKAFPNLDVDEADTLDWSEGMWFENLIATPAKQHISPSKRTVVILDGMQNIMNKDDRHALLRLVWMHWAALAPPWLCLVATVGPSITPEAIPGLIERNHQLNVDYCYIDARDEKHEEDMFRVYHSKLKSQNKLPDFNADKIVRARVQQLFGSPLYYSKLSDGDVETGNDDAKYFGQQFASTFQRILDGLGNIETAKHVYAAAFGPLSCTKEAMPKQLWLHCFAGYHPEKRSPTKREMQYIMEALYIPETLDDKVQFTHPAMQTWLTNARLHTKGSPLLISLRKLNTFLACKMYPSLCNEAAIARQLPSIILDEAITGRRPQPHVGQRKGSSKSPAYQSKSPLLKETQKYILENWMYHLHHAQCSHLLVSDLYNILSLSQLGMSFQILAREIRHTMRIATGKAQAKLLKQIVRDGRTVRDEMLLLALLLDDAPKSPLQLPSHILFSLPYSLPHTAPKSLLGALVQQCVAYTPGKKVTSWLRPIACSPYLDRHGRDVLEMQSLSMTASYSFPMEVLHVAISPNSQYVVACLADNSMYTVRIGERVATLFPQTQNTRHIGSVTCIKFSPTHDNIFVTGGVDGRVGLWDAEARMPLFGEIPFLNERPAGGNNFGITCVAFSTHPSKQLVACGRESGSISVWKFSNDGSTTEQQIEQHTTPVFAISIGNNLMVSVEPCGAIVFFNLETFSVKRVQHLFNDEAHVDLAEYVNLTVNESDDRIYVASRTKRWMLTADGEQVWSQQSWSPAPLLGCFELNEVFESYHSLNEMKVRFSDKQLVGKPEHRELCFIAHRGQVSSASMSNEYIVSGSFDQSVRIWDSSKLQRQVLQLSSGASKQLSRKNHFTSPQFLASLPCHIDTISCHDVSNNHETVVSGALDGILHFWDTRSGCMKHNALLPITFDEQLGRETVAANDPAMLSPVVAVAFFRSDQNGKEYVVSGDSHNVVSIWDTSTLEQVLVFSLSGSIACLSGLTGTHGFICSTWDGKLLLFRNNQLAAADVDEPIVNITRARVSQSNERVEIILSTTSALRECQDLRVIFETCRGRLDLKLRPMSISPRSDEVNIATNSIPDVEDCSGLDVSRNPDGTVVPPMKFKIADNEEDVDMVTIAKGQQLIFLQRIDTSSFEDLDDDEDY